jgi:hypothetical protein
MFVEDGGLWRKFFDEVLLRWRMKRFAFARLQITFVNILVATGAGFAGYGLCGNYLTGCSYFLFLRRLVGTKAKNGCKKDGGS